MLMKLSSYQSKLNYYNCRMLTVVFMVTKENICRIYTKRNLKEKIVHNKKTNGMQMQIVMEEMRARKAIRHTENQY